MVMCGFKLVITLVLMRFSAVFPGGGRGEGFVFPRVVCLFPEEMNFYY